MEDQQPRTLGMQLDSALGGLESLNTTQVYYALIVVTVTVIISFGVLGSPTEMPEIQVREIPKRRAQNPREPRWHIFRWVNYAVVAVLVWSVADFAMHWQQYLNSSDNVLLQFLFGWSVLLCYFFGFFGVTFVHDTIAEPESAEARILAPTPKRPSSLPKKKILPAASCTPSCSDPSKPTKPQQNTSSVKPNVDGLSDEEIAQLVLSNQMKDHELEKRLDTHRAVQVRRLVVDHKLTQLGHAGALEQLPHIHDLDYSRVHGANCEIVVGYVPLPVGMVGPLTLNGESFLIPMATTEGCLVASTNRGAKAITQSGGANAVILRDGITRAPCVRMESAMAAAELKLWCEEPQNFAMLKQVFESTTSFGKLKKCDPTVAGKNVYLRLTCFSGDAMGMNMVSKGSLAVIDCLKQHFPALNLVALSGNMCTDKKAAATNWIEGRGKSVVVETTIPKEVVRSVLKTNVKAMVSTNIHKNLVGSAMAGTIGGFNAHASNIVTAVFLATGQDPAQNVESSNCITLLEETDSGDLWMSCTMPSLEVGTVGGGTSLAAQSACLQALGCKGGGAVPGENSQQLAKIIAAATLAGEMSLLAALAANTLVAAHMQHNRKAK